MARSPRDIERHSTQEVAAKLHRLADSIEKDEPFRIPDRRGTYPRPGAGWFSIEHELGDDEEEIEFQLKWPVKAQSEVEPEEGPVV
jgi:amphi-Trp domain-containing protein